VLFVVAVLGYQIYNMAIAVLYAPLRTTVNFVHHTAALVSAYIASQGYVHGYIAVSPVSQRVLVACSLLLLVCTFDARMQPRRSLTDYVQYSFGVFESSSIMLCFIDIFKLFPTLITNLPGTYTYVFPYHFLS
jgi:hypothetical protein